MNAIHDVVDVRPQPQLQLQPQLRVRVFVGLQIALPAPMETTCVEQQIPANALPQLPPQPQLSVPTNVRQEAYGVQVQQHIIPVICNQMDVTREEVRKAVRSHRLAQMASV